MFQTLKIILSVLIALVVTIFSVKNSSIVDINLWPLPLQFRLTLSLVLIGTFATGALFGGLLVWISHLRKHFLKAQKKKNQE